jgi:predicted alpha/beta superfamily hydrolase/peptidoglycan/xylan/chitin deacetylase (PgdA/CDA1 family)
LRLLVVVLAGIPHLALGAAAAPSSAVLEPLPGASSPVRDAPPDLAGLRLAITLDDLPWVGPLPEGDTAAIQGLDRIAAALRAHGAPATGFVVCERAREDEAPLRAWAARGFALGNHSWSHHDLNATTADAWTDDVRRCDAYLKGYGSAYAPFFRFPMLHQGDTREKRDSAAASLAALGLRTAHVTVDNSGWLLTQADARATRAHDAARREEVRRALVHHIVAAVEHADRVARRKVGRPVAQVLLLHANTMVDHDLDALLTALSARGVEFVSLEEALRDPVYARPDDYVGRKGLSWLYRIAPASPEDARWDDAQADSIRDRFLRAPSGASDGGAEAARVTGRLDIVDLRSRVFHNTRHLRVWLPPGYSDAENHDVVYPVLYLNDGQNLFDASTSTFSHDEWGVDEAATELIRSGATPPFVVVGIDHAGRRARAREYLPFPDSYLDPPEPHPQGRLYGDFLETEVLPLVERRYRVSRTREGRFLGGSSYGALIALYVAITRPRLFGGLLLESPSFYVDDSRILKQLKPERLRLDRVYLGVGTNELGRPGCPEKDPDNREAVEDVSRAAGSFRAAGLSEPDELEVVVDRCATHGEAAWAKRIGPALAFLFGR